MSQPAQGTRPNNKKNFNWKSLLFVLILLGILIVLGLWWFNVFGPHTPYVSFSKFKSYYQEAIKLPNDDIYIEKITQSSFNGHVEFIYVNGSVTSKYQTTIFASNLDFQNPNVSSSGFDFTKTGGKNPTEVIFASAPKNNSWIWSLLSFLLPLCFFIFLFWSLRKAQGSSGGIFSQGKNQAQKIISNKKFSDVAGQMEVKEEISEVVDFLKKPSKYKAAGARIPKGILLGGPPGTGKTLLAKATAGEAGVPFYFISASNFVEMFAGVGAKRVREMFKEARRDAPAILFIDELDAVGRKRGSSLSGNDEREQTLNQILVEMDGMQENAGLLIIAATNRPDVLDPALQRPGRFDRTITVNNPDVKEREAILKLHARGKKIDSKISFANIAKRTPGYSGAQLENIVNEAALLSVRENTGIILIHQIDEAIDRVVAGPAKKHRVITPKELEMVSYHEAGHAVIGLKVQDAELVQKITIIPRGSAGGYTLMTPKKETYNFKKSELLAKIVSYMGGRAAEQIIYGQGEVSTGAHNDIERATTIARAMVTQYGMSILGPIAYERTSGPEFLGQDQRSKDYSDALAERIDEAIRELIVNAEKQAIKVIKENRKLLKLLSEELLEKETIVLEEINYINKHLKRPPKKEKVIQKKQVKSLKNVINEVKNDSKKNKN